MFLHRYTDSGLYGLNSIFIDRMITLPWLAGAFEECSLQRAEDTSYLGSCNNFVRYIATISTASNIAKAMTLLTIDYDDSHEWCRKSLLILWRMGKHCCWSRATNHRLNEAHNQGKECEGSWWSYQDVRRCMKNSTAARSTENSKWWSNELLSKGTVMRREREEVVYSRYVIGSPVPKQWQTYSHLLLTACHLSEVLDITCSKEVENEAKLHIPSQISYPFCPLFSK